MEKRIVTLTLNPALDKITGIKQVVPNKKLRCDTPNYEAGGGGINVSRAIRRLEGKSLAIFPSGGRNGEILESKLEEEKVTFRTIPIQDLTRQNLTVFEGNSKQNFRFILPGPHLSENEWKEILNIFDDLDPKPDYIVISGSCPNGTPKDFFKKLTKTAKKLDAHLIVDTSGDVLRSAAEAGVYLLKPNIRELGELTDTDIESETNVKEAAQELIESGNAEVIIVSLGAGGALLVTENTTEQLRTPTVPIRSRLGAGDSMVGGIVLKLSQGKSIREATLYGIAAGAATVMTEGIELCNKSDTDNLFEKLSEKESD